MPELELISHHLCPFVQRAVIVLQEKGISHKRTYIDLANKPDWFLKLSPLGRVPVLKVGDQVLFESQVIAEYLDETTPGSLHPADPLEKARHRSWIEFGSETLGAVAGIYSANAEEFDDRKAALRAKLERIEPEIVGPHFAGENFHLIDGVWGTIFRYLDVYENLAGLTFTDGLDRVATWRQTVMNRPAVRDAVPEGYEERLRAFLVGRDSHLSGLIESRSVAA